jgi:hypothetical protein
MTANAARYGLGGFAALRVILRSRRPGASAAETARALGRLARGEPRPEGCGSATGSARSGRFACGRLHNCP